MLFHCVTIFEWLGCTLARSCDSGSAGDVGYAMNRCSICPRLTGTLCAQPGCHRCSKQCPCTVAGSTEVLRWQEISEISFQQSPEQEGVTCAGSTRRADKDALWQ